jgi:hypothetical protein
MDDTTLRLRARLTILEQASVRLFTVLGAEHTSEVKAVVENFDQAFQNARGLRAVWCEP